MKDLIAKLQSDACVAMGAIWIHIDAREARIAELEAENTNLRYELNAALSGGTVSCLSADTDKLREAILALPMQVPRVAGGSVALLSPWEQTCFNNGAIAMRKAAAELVASTALQAPVREVPEGWEFNSADFSLKAAGHSNVGHASLIRDMEGRAAWHALDEAAKDTTPLYLYGKGETIADAIADAVKRTPAAPVQEPKP